MMYRALVIEEGPAGRRAQIREVERGAIAEGHVRVRVHHSGINYKDALAVTGRGKIIRAGLPFVPGIDLAGVVEESASGLFAPGDQVIGTGWGLGETIPGGYASVQDVPAEVLVPMPVGMTSFDAMALGTAGLTAMLSVMALEDAGIGPDQGAAVVSGATGGVGSLAVHLLAGLGFKVVAVSGKPQAEMYLKDIGATEVIPREEVTGRPSKPLESARWIAGVDTVGGPLLAAMIAATDRHGAVAACGNAGGHELNTTVFPFILRGVSLLGIDSNTCPPAKRERAWRRLSQVVTTERLQAITTTIALDGISDACTVLLDAGMTGRYVVDLRK